VVHEDTGELAAHRLVEEGRGHRGVHSAGEGQKHPVLADPAPDILEGPSDEILGGPALGDGADAAGKILEQPPSHGGVDDLRVELQAVPSSARGAGDGRERSRRRMGQLAHSSVDAEDLVAVAHPGLKALWQTLEEWIWLEHLYLRETVLPFGGPGDFAPMGPGQKLHPVADAQNRDAGLPQVVQKPGRQLGRAFLIRAGGAAGKDHPARLLGQECLLRHMEGQDLGVDFQFPEPAGDELGVLRAVVEDQNHKPMRMGADTKRMSEDKPKTCAHGNKKTGPKGPVSLDFISARRSKCRADF